MIRFPYFIATLVVGFFLQILSNNYFTVYGVGPNLLLLIVVTHGFLFGPLVGAVMGFSLGIIADAMGVTLFGLNGLLLTFMGYLAGNLRRRVASERPTGQFIIALVATVVYRVGASFVASTFESVQRISVASVVLASILNSLMMPVIFSATEKWTFIWRETPQ